MSERLGFKVETISTRADELVREAKHMFSTLSQPDRLRHARALAHGYAEAAADDGRWDVAVLNILAASELNNRHANYGVIP